MKKNIVYLFTLFICCSCIQSVTSSQHTTKKIVNKTEKEFFYEGNTLDYNFRKNSLINLRNAIKKYEKEIINALNKDLGKSEFEAYTNEIGILYENGSSKLYEKISFERIRINKIQ